MNISFKVLVYPQYVESKFLIVMSIEEWINDTVRVGDQMCHIKNHVTKIFITRKLEVYQQPENLVGKSANNKHRHNDGESKQNLPSLFVSAFESYNLRARASGARRCRFDRRMKVSLEK